MGSSPKPPKPSQKQQELEALQIDLMEKQLEELEKPPQQIKLPKPLPPPPPPAMVSADTEAAGYAARSQAMRRTNTARRTLFAGETGGYKGPKTLLG